MDVERTRWTDERIDDALDAIRHGSVRHEEEFSELRSETRSEIVQLRNEIGLQRGENRSEFSDVRTEFSDVRNEMREGFAEMRGEMVALRLMVLRLGGGLMVGFGSVIATILLRAPA